jgi:peroxiredoxin
VLLLSDGNGELAHAMGVELDLSDKPTGLDVRSRRYAFLAEDGARWV